MSPSSLLDEGEPDRVHAGDEPTPLKRGQTTQERLAERKGGGFLHTVLRTLVGLAVVALLLVGIFLAASALEGDPKVERAPWAAKSAPDVKPDGLADQ